MQLPSLRSDWGPPRTWFVTARLLEIAAAVMIAATVLQSWMIFETTTQAFAPNGDPTPEGPAFLDRVAMFAMFGFGFAQTSVGGLVAGFLLLGVLAVLHFAVPVGHASVLRWEVLSLWVAAALVNVALVLASVVGLVRGDPNAPEEGTITFSSGPGVTEQLLGGLATPVVCLVLLGVSAIWWLRLPEEFDEPDDEPVRQPRHWRPAPAQDANVDDITLDGVELIEPVERLHPRDDTDGSTPSGYDDYFRRF